MSFDINYLQNLIKSDEARKERNFMLYSFYQNCTEEIRDYVTSYMLGATIQRIEKWHYENGIPVSDIQEGQGMFSPDTIKIMPKFHRDITNKTLNNICTSYHTGIDRYLVDKDGAVDQEQTDLLNEIYKNACASLWQKEWYKQGKLFNCVEVRAVWRKKTNKLEFDIWTPNFFTVVENNESYLYKDAILFDLTMVIDGVEKDVKEYWSDTEHYLLVFKGTKKAGKAEIDIYEKLNVKNGDGSNPYKTIPSQELRFRVGQDYYGTGMFDLVENNIWHDVEESNRLVTAIIKGSGGILYAVNMGKRGAISLQPFMVNCVDGVSRELADPKIEAVPMNANIAELIDGAKNNIQQILMTKGLSSQAGTVDNQNATGISKALDQDELEMQKQEDQMILMDFEPKFYEKVRTVYNYHTTETKLKDDLKFVCQFNKKKTALSQADLINKWRFEINEIGVKTPVDYLTDDNPSMTVEEAEEIIKTIKDKRIADGDLVLQGDGQGNPRTAEPVK